ncbi:hypothetical protein EXIGLDRAFT_838613 [Exidia glandulosa HHB12029]|uniref:DUF6532 domain-containing protein n=1 Tax=Exidia glandulosa HHB12029 TaxID=1314781 RepID=A0A165FP47_EXIGL|nr:hypothetical protein EXIGLDRAFT_838613 [Exidia glandulosa HHB12029]
MEVVHVNHRLRRHRKSNGRDTQSTRKNKSVSKQAAPKGANAGHKGTATSLGNDSEDEDDDAGSKNSDFERTFGTDDDEDGDTSLTHKRLFEGKFLLLYPSDSGSESEQEQARRVAKKRKTVPEVDVSDPVPLRRGQQSTQSNTRPTTPEPTAPEIPCTPYVRVPDPKKKNETLEKLFTPPSQSALQLVKPEWAVFIITQNAYPDESTVAKKVIFARLKRALKKGAAGDANRIGRICDKEYVNVMIRNIFVTGSGVRSHIILIARHLVEHEYNLRHKMINNVPESVDQRRRRVTLLIAGSSFACTNPTAGVGFGERPVIHELLTRAFFTSSSPLYNLGACEEFIEDFKTWPLAMIAFACTAINHCLTEWQTGVFKQSKFTERTSSTIYANILKALKVVSAGGAALPFEQKREAWYRDAWSKTELSSGVDNAPTLDAIILRSRAALLGLPEPEPGTYEDEWDAEQRQSGAIVD